MVKIIGGFVTEGLVFTSEVRGAWVRERMNVKCVRDLSALPDTNADESKVSADPTMFF